jgi:hypothetical protein
MKQLTNGLATMNNAPTPPITDPAERNAWKSGFTPQAEIWNGRLAMMALSPP